MVSSLQALSVAIAGALSGAGWIYLNPFATLNNSTISTYDPAAAAAAAAGNHSSSNSNTATLADSSNNNNLELGEYGQLLKPILEWVQPAPATAAAVAERELSDVDYESLRRGRWLVFVFSATLPALMCRYAPWCPHSRAYMQLWSRLVERTREAPPANPPVLASVNFSGNPGLAAGLGISKLPSFVVIDGGRLFGTVSSATLEDLLDAAATDWAAVVAKRRRLPRKPSRVGRFNMRAFDYLGGSAIRLQEAIIDWIHLDMLRAYVLITTAGVGIYIARKRGYLTAV